MPDIAQLDIRITTKDVKSGTKDLQKLEQQGYKTEKSAQSMSKGFNSAMLAFKGLAAAFGAYKIAGLIKESALLAARYETLGVVMNVVGRNAGYLSSEMDTYSKKLMDTGISAIEARNNLARMTQAQLDLSKSSKLARIAQDAAVIGNTNSSDAFARLVYGIQSAQTEILRSVGINVNFENSYKKLAAQIGKTANELTETEKAQARMDVVMEAGTRISGAYAEAMETTGKKISSLDRYHENLKVQIGETFSPATSAAVDVYTFAIKGLLEGVTGLNNIMTALGMISKGELGWIDYLSMNHDELKAYISDVDTLVGLQKRIDELSLRKKDTLYARDREAIQDRIDALKAEFAQLKAMEAYRKGGDISDFWLTRDKGYEAAIPRGEKVANELAKDASRVGEKRADALAQVEDTIAKLTMTAREYDKYSFSKEVEKLGKQLGTTNPKIMEMVAAFDRAQKIELVDEELESFFGDIDEKSRRRVEENLQVQTEFSREYVRLVKGDSAAQMAEIERRAKAYLKAGNDSTTVAEWEAKAKLDASRKWSDGAIRYLDDYYYEATDMAANMENVFSKAFGGMEDALVDFVQTGKLDFKSLTDSIIADLIRIQVRESITGPLAGGLSSVFKGLFSAHGNVLGGAGISALSNGIYSQPTYFGYDTHVKKFASGGVLGEAGPEAVMPLTRTASGDLGVKMDGGKGQTRTLTVRIKDQNGQQISKSTSFDVSALDNHILDVVWVGMSNNESGRWR